MDNNSLAKGVVKLANVVNEVLLQIGDVEKKKYYVRVLQSVLNKYRKVNVHYALFYKEAVIEIDPDLRTAEYPSDLVRVISVGVYRNGEWWDFTRKPQMARTITGDGGTYDEDFNEDEDIARRGVRFGARGHNIGFWVEDNENCRVFVRNYLPSNYTEGDPIKAILKYRSNGINCNGETCIPTKVKDFVISDVVYDLAMNRIPYRHTAMELESKRMERSRHFDEYTDLEYLPQNMGEFLDAEYASFNSTIRRS